MTLDEAIAVLEVFAARHPDGGSWSLSDGYLRADWWAPDEADADRLTVATVAMYDLEDAVSVVLAVVKDGRR